MFLEKGQKDPQGLLDFENRTLLKSLGSERPFHQAFRDEVRSIDPDLPVVGLEVMDDVVEAASMSQQAVSTLLGLAGSLMSSTSWPW